MIYLYIYTHVFYVCTIIDLHTFVCVLDKILYILDRTIHHKSVYFAVWFGVSEPIFYPMQ